MASTMTLSAAIVTSQQKHLKNCLVMVHTSSTLEDVWCENQILGALKQSIRSFIEEEVEDEKMTKKFMCGGQIMITC